MATVNRMHNDDHAHRVFMRAFSETTQRQLMADDSLAWRSVTGVLITIVSVGLVLAFVALIVAT